MCACVYVRCALRFGWDDVRRFHLTCFLSQIIFCTSVWHFKGINLPTVKMTVNDYYCHRSSFTNMAIFDKIKSINLTYTHKCAISSELKRKKNVIKILTGKLTYAVHHRVRWFSKRFSTGCSLGWFAMFCFFSSPVSASKPILFTANITNYIISESCGKSIK